MKHSFAHKNFPQLLPLYGIAVVVLLLLLTTGQVKAQEAQYYTIQ
jgi:hypothetical protein